MKDRPSDDLAKSTNHQLERPCAWWAENRPRPARAARSAFLFHRRPRLALGGLLLVSALLTGINIRNDGGAGHPEEDRLSGREIEVLLVSGLHTNESCAPLIAEKVRGLLEDRGIRVSSFRVPRPLTLIGLLDDPATADTRHSMPTGTTRLDMDLEGLDAILGERHPHALVFEFHNSEDSARILAIDPTKPVCDYEIGTLGPPFTRPYEIATWRNTDLQARPSKYVVETPARYASVGPERLARRRSRLGWLRHQGREFDARWMPYLEREADVESSRERGYLDDCLARKIAAWIAGRREAERHAGGSRGRPPR